MTSNTRRTSVDLLLVEDDAEDARHVQRLLSTAGTAPGTERMIEFGSIEHAERLSEALARLDDRTPDVVLLDLRLPDSEGLETLERVVDSAPDVPVVVTGSAETGLGPAAIRTGAQDYLEKGSITGELLRRTLRHAIERHERDREIATTNRRLTLLNELVRRDVRNDLGVIVGWGDEIRDQVDREGAEIADNLLETAHDTVERIETVAAIMDVLSTSSGVEREPVDLASIVREEVARVRDRHDVELVVRFDGEDEALTVAATPMLSAVFRQLFSNAVSHSDRETPRLTVTVAPSPDTVSVVVGDDGVGIPDAQKERLDSLAVRNHDRSGIGTGLFLVLAVLEQIGADIAFADNELRGALVTVTLERTGAV